MTIMQYFCKNPQCNRIFLAEDLYGRITPETFRYCEKCEGKGFTKIRSDKKNAKKIRTTTFKSKLF